MCPYGDAWAICPVAVTMMARLPQRDQASIKSAEHARRGAQNNHSGALPQPSRNPGNTYLTADSCAPRDSRVITESDDADWLSAGVESVVCRASHAQSSSRGRCGRLGHQGAGARVLARGRAAARPIGPAPALRPRLHRSSGLGHGGWSGWPGARRPRSSQMQAVACRTCRGRPRGPRLPGPGSKIGAGRERFGVLRTGPPTA